MKHTKHTKTAFHKFGSYVVSSLGNVYSTTKWRSYTARPMTQHLDQDGYRYVRLTFNGKRKMLRVHRLVCVLFNGAQPTPKHQVCHVDGNKLNNAASNLRWGTPKDNANDRASHGRTSKGTKHSTAIKSSSHKAKVKRGNEHYKAIAKATGGSL